MKKIAVVLSGCGHRDGSEVTEAVSAVIALSEVGAKIQFFAPSIEFQAVNHLTQKTTETRNTLIESARIARGQIQDLRELNPADFDGVVLPGGYGAATRLSDWSTKGSSCSVLPDVEQVIREFHKQHKPIAAICIAPALIARVLGKNHVTVTLGNDPAAASEIEKTGAHHEACAVSDYVTDREAKVITTPAYMYNSASPFEVFTGVRRAIREFYEMS